jgi:hypothetical protein
VTIAVKSPTNNTTPHVDLSANEPGVTFACKLNGQVMSTAATSFNLPPVLNEGSNLLSCNGTDSSANVGHADKTMVLDTVAPIKMIVGGPQGPVQVNPDGTLDHTFQLYGDAVIGECRIDSGPYIADIGDTFRAPFTPGVHNIYCRMIDAAGNVGPDSDPYTVTVLA